VEREFLEDFWREGTKPQQATRDNNRSALREHNNEFWYSKRMSIGVNTVPLFPPTLAQQPLVGQGLLIIEASRSHSDTSHSVGLLWTCVQSVAETSTWQHTTLTTDKTSMPPAGNEPATPAIERPQSHALERAAIGLPLGTEIQTALGRIYCKLLPRYYTPNKFLLHWVLLNSKPVKFVRSHLWYLLRRIILYPRFPRIAFPSATTFQPSDVWKTQCVSNYKYGS
jgi:hypothetical protein